MPFISSTDFYIISSLATAKRDRHRSNEKAQLRRRWRRDYSNNKKETAKLCVQPHRYCTYTLFTELSPLKKTEKKKKTSLQTQSCLRGWSGLNAHSTFKMNIYTIHKWYRTAPSETNRNTFCAFHHYGTKNIRMSTFIHSGCWLNFQDLSVWQSAVDQEKTFIITQCSQNAS